MTTFDFSLGAFERLLQALQRGGFKITLFRDFPAAPSGAQVSLRHDVDRLPLRAVQMGQLEARLGVASTYFFRTKPGVFDDRAIKELSGLGHEIGFHYESLADARGDMAMAWDLFRRDLDRIRAIVPVTSIAMHGRPMSAWDSRKLWQHFHYRSLGIDRESYLDVDWRGVLYYTDTGRSWNGPNNLRDRPLIDDALPSPAQPSTEALASFLVERGQPAVVSSHPERWSRTFAQWAYSSAVDLAVNMAKQGIRRLRRSE